MRILTLAFLVALRASAVDASTSTTTPFVADLKTEFGGWFALGAASIIRKDQIEKAGQLTLAEFLNISESSIVCVGEIYHTTTLTTTTTTSTSTITTTNSTSTLKVWPLTTTTTNVTSTTSTSNATTSTSTNATNTTTGTFYTTTTTNATTSTSSTSSNTTTLAGTVLSALTQSSSVGTNTLRLADVSGLSAGMSLTISGGGNSETRTIVSVNPGAIRRLSSVRRLVAGTVTLNGPLENSYMPGAQIVATPQAHTCTTGAGTACATCVALASRITSAHCDTCNPGYEISGTMCQAHTCTTGAGSACETCVTQVSRRTNAHCEACNPGYEISGTSCQAHTCTTGTGAACETCVVLASRTTNAHCEACNPGYEISGTICQAHTCTTGTGAACETCVALASRATNAHCDTCNPGYEISGTICQATTEPEPANINGARLLEEIYYTTSMEPEAMTANPEAEQEDIFHTTSMEPETTTTNSEAEPEVYTTSMVQARRSEADQLNINETTIDTQCNCSCPFTTVTTSSLSSTIMVIGAEPRELVHLISTTSGPWRIQNEHTQYWNVSYTITIPVEQTDDIRRGIEEIAGDQTSFNESLWMSLVYTQNVDPALSIFYEYVGFALTSEILVYPATRPAPEEPSKPWPEISAMIAILVFTVLLLLISYYITFRTKVSHWKKVESSKIHLDILFETKPFSMFCMGKGFDHNMSVIRTSPWEKATPRWWRRAWVNYCKWLANTIKVFLIAGWRYVIGVGLYSLAMSNCIRAARDLEHSDRERMVSDETIDANLAAAKKVFQIVLPLTGTMLLVYIVTRMIWLNEGKKLCNKFARCLEEIASMCMFLLPPVDMGFEVAPPHLAEVTKARYLIYCYFNTLHLFFFSDSSEQLKYGVHELVFQEALSRSKLLLEREEEELYKSHDCSTQLFIWSSRLVIEIARSCESNSGRPCQQELMEKLLVLQKTLHRFQGKIKQRSPVSFMQLMHLMVDGTVIITPMAIAETCGADHHSYSFYFFPWICSLLLALFFQGSLRFAKVTDDPFGAGCSGESYTNECLLSTERTLYTILALRRRYPLDVDLPAVSMPPHPEPVWTGDTSQDFLKRDFLNELYQHPDPPLLAPAPEPKQKARRTSGSSDRRSSTASDELALGDINFEDVPDFNDYSEGIDDPEVLSRPPDAVVSSSSNDAPPQAKSMQERLEDAEKELAETEMERRVLRDLVKQREKQMIELEAESIPADDANELIKLMSEWVNPKRPVRVSDVTFFKLAELARKQTTRVKKILALPIAGRSDPYSQTHRHITAASLIASEAVNKHDSDGVKLMKHVRARLDEEEKATSRLKYQLAETIARAKGESLTDDGKKIVKVTKANVNALEKQTSTFRSLTQGATGNLSEKRIADDDFEMRLKEWEASNSLTMMNSSQRSQR